MPQPRERRKLLYLKDAPAVFGGISVALKDLIDWAMRTQRVLPPTYPNIFEYRHIDLDAFLHAMRRGAEMGDVEHVVRAAIALVDADAASQPAEAELIRQRDPHAARTYLLERGVQLWADALRVAVAGGRVLASRVTKPE
jgi:hypothetical protein